MSDDPGPEAMIVIAAFVAVMSLSALAVLLWAVR